tara:strand:+ start:359 stop:469 length:111 start_codon:yes stop_codon:yes gene_type:complete
MLPDIDWIFLFSFLFTTGFYGLEGDEKITGSSFFDV